MRHHATSLNFLLCDLTYYHEVFPKFPRVCRDIIGSLNVEVLEGRDLPKVGKHGKKLPNVVVRVPLPPSPRFISSLYH